MVDGEGDGFFSGCVVEAEGFGEVLVAGAHAKLVAEEVLGGILAGLLLGAGRIRVRVRVRGGGGGGHWAAVEGFAGKVFDVIPGRGGEGKGAAGMVGRERVEEEEGEEEGFFGEREEEEGRSVAENEGRRERACQWHLSLLCSLLASERI